MNFCSTVFCLTKKCVFCLNLCNLKFSNLPFTSKTLSPPKMHLQLKKKQTNSHSQCNVRQFAFQKHPFKHPKKAILKNDRCNCISSFLQLLWIDESMNDGLMNRCGNFLCTSEKPSLGWSMFCTSSKSQLAPGFEGHLCWTKQC